MKYWIIGLMVVAIVAAAYWAGTKKNSGDSVATESPVLSASPANTSGSTVSYTPVSQQSPTSSVSGNATIGNKTGNLAPDFRLKDSTGKYISLRDYLGREEIKLIFGTSGELTLQPSSIPQGIILSDPNDTVHRLYGVTTVPYTVIIDINGIIR